MQIGDRDKHMSLSGEQISRLLNAGRKGAIPFSAAGSSFLHIISHIFTLKV